MVNAYVFTGSESVVNVVERSEYFVAVITIIWVVDGYGFHDY